MTKKKTTSKTVLSDSVARVKLNLGAREWRPAGYLSVDISGADVNRDLRVPPWPWADASISEILASHILEHFDKPVGRIFLEECFRVLAPAGVLHLAVPDLDKFITAHATGDYGPLGGYFWTDINDFMGGGSHEQDEALRHRYMYTFDSLAFALQDIGFVKAKTVEGGDLHNPAYAAISLYVDATR
jgi:hypothetical protein